MEKNHKKNIIIGISLLILVMLLLLGLTYAYYRTRIIGNESKDPSISVVSKNLELTYVNGSELITEIILPGDSLTKNFSIKNTGSDVIENFGIYLEDVVNELYHKDALTYTLTCAKTNANGDDLGSCAGLESQEYPYENTRILIDSINAGEIYNYELIISYEETDYDQYQDMGAELAGKVKVALIADVVDIEGEILAAAEGDYVQINSVKKVSRIINGEYKLTAVEPGTHTLSVYSKDDVLKGKTSITINKGKTENVSGNEITIIEASNTVTININEIATTLGVSISEDIQKYSNIVDKVNVGDYVLYNYNAATYTTPTVDRGKSVHTSTQTFSSNASGNAEITKWRILSKENGEIKLIGINDYALGIDEEGNIDYKLQMTGNNAYLNGPDILNEMCNTLYSSNYGNARSINGNDINKILDYNGTKNYTNANGEKVYISKQDIKTIRDLETEVGVIPGSRIAPNGLVFEELVVNNYGYGTVNSNDANIGSPLVNSASNPLMMMINGKVYGNGGLNYYWLADSVVQVDYSDAEEPVAYRVLGMVGGSLGSFKVSTSEGDEWTRTFAVVPVVILNYDVDVIESSEVIDSSYKTWELN